MTRTDKLRKKPDVEILAHTVLIHKNFNVTLRLYTWKTRLIWECSSFYFTNAANRKEKMYHPSKHKQYLLHYQATLLKILDKIIVRNNE